MNMMNIPNMYRSPQVKLWWMMMAWRVLFENNKKTGD